MPTSFFAHYTERTRATLEIRCRDRAFTSMIFGPRSTRVATGTRWPRTPSSWPGGGSRGAVRRRRPPRARTESRWCAGGNGSPEGGDKVAPVARDPTGGSGRPWTRRRRKGSISKSETIAGRPAVERELARIVEPDLRSVDRRSRRSMSVREAASVGALPSGKAGHAANFSQQVYGAKCGAGVGPTTTPTSSCTTARPGEDGVGDRHPLSTRRSGPSSPCARPGTARLRPPPGPIARD